MRKKFRVLLIDDNAEVLNRLKAIVQRDVKAGNESIKIEVSTLHVRLTTDDGELYKVSEETIRSLGICCEAEFDYIFSDFGYVGDFDKSNALTEELIRTRRIVTKKDFQGNVLQLLDIKSTFLHMQLPELERARIENYFFHHRGKILIYTNSPYPYDSYFISTEIPIRINEVKDVFPELSEDPYFILMHEEFPTTPEILEAFKGKDAEKKEYFSVLLSNYIDHAMQFVALQYMVSQQGKLKFVNVEKAFKFLTKIAIGLGAVTALFGEVIYHFFEDAITTLFTPKLHFDEDIVGRFTIAILITLIAMFAISKYGRYVAEKTEERMRELL